MRTTAIKKWARKVCFSGCISFRTMFDTRFLIGFTCACTAAGQKGWSGWAPHAVVYGAEAPATGLVTLVDASPSPTCSATVRAALGRLSAPSVFL